MLLTDDYSHFVGTTRTDYRGWKYVVASVKFKHGGRFSTDALIVEGRCIENKPSGVRANSTTYDAYCCEIFRDGDTIESPLARENDGQADEVAKTEER